jgi:hypothetical protein
MDLSRRRIKRVRGGAYQVRLRPEELTLLHELVPQLRELLTATTDDPSVRRLFPTAYNEDPERDREYQALVRDELLERRLSALDTVEETLDEDRLDEDQMGRWMGALNDLRLVIGTRLDVDESLPRLDADDPRAPAYAVYEYLGWLLDQVVSAMSEALPDVAE